MPTYDYQCDGCGHTFEAFQPMRDDPLTDCPECGAPELRRLISGGTGVIFKGSGFYVNDSRKGAAAAGTGGSTSGKNGSDRTGADGGAGGAGGGSADSAAGGSDGGSTGKGGGAKAGESSGNSPVKKKSSREPAGTRSV